MHTYYECYPCFLRQVLEMVRLVSDDDEILGRVLRSASQMLVTFDLRRSPPEFTEQFQKVIAEVTACADPFREVKHRFNALVLDMLPSLRERIEWADDPFDTAVRLALAGNIIDFGTPGQVTHETILDSIKRSESETIHGVSSHEMRVLVDQAASILYVGDNAGEIAFDKLLIERLGPERITFAVRGGPTINDVTMDDALQVGLTDLVDVIDTGLSVPGVVLSRSGSAFKQAFRKASLVIAKGQGNFETMNDVPKPTLFLFKVKCPVVQQFLGLPLHTMVIGGRRLPEGMGGRSSPMG